MSGLEEPQLDKLRSLRAVTLRQVHDAELVRDNLFRIDGKDVDQVTFVGNITQMSILPAGVSFEIEDGTGMTTIHKWMEPTDEDPEFADRLQGVGGGSYVRVSGSLRFYKNKASIVAYTIVPIESGNEMMYHLLEAIAQHLQITRGPPKPAQGMEIDGNDDYTQHPPAPRASQKHANTASNKIMDYLASLSDADMLPNDGVLDSIVAQNTGLSRHVVSDEIAKLAQLGAIYFGNDENHVFPTAT